MGRTSSYLIRGISYRLAVKTVNALEKSRRAKAKAQQKVAASKLSTQTRVQPKPSIKEEESAALIAVMVAGVFLLFAIGMDWKYILGAIAVIGVLILLIPISTPKPSKPTKFSSEKVIPKFITVSKPRAVELSQEQRLRYEWAVQTSFWGTAIHDERTFLNNQTVTLERQYQDYLRHKMEQGFIGPETIKEQTIENVKEAKQNLWKKLDRKIN